MGSPLYNITMGNNQPISQIPFHPSNMMQNFYQQAAAVMQVLNTNPIQYLLQKFPDIPANIQNNPNLIFQYLQNTRNIPNENIQRLMNMFPRQF